jgi:hypothetical protein
MRHGPHWDCQTAKRPDVGSLPCTISYLAGVMLHNGFCVEAGSPRDALPSLRPALYFAGCGGEVLYKHDTSDDSCFPHQAKDPESWLSASSFSYFLSRCQRLSQNPISASLPFRPRLSALCSSQEFSHQLEF